MTEDRIRGGDQNNGRLFSCLDLEERVSKAHPFRIIRSIVNDVLGSLSSDFEALYSPTGRPSVPPEKLFQDRLTKTGKRRKTKIDGRTTRHPLGLEHKICGGHTSISPVRHGLPSRVSRLALKINVASECTHDGVDNSDRNPCSL